MRRRLLPALLLAVACLFQQAAFGRPKVLLVFDEDRTLPGLSAFHRSFRDAIRRELKDEVDLYVESLEVSRFQGPRHETQLGEHLRAKYGEAHRPDVIVAVMQPSLDFLVAGGKPLFPGVPIVSTGIDASAKDAGKLPPDVTGIFVKRSFAPTLELALRLAPETRDVVVVGGTSPFDRQIQSVARRELQSVQPRLNLTWLTDATMDQVLAHVSRLPKGTVVYYLTLIADGEGRSFVPHDALARIAGAASVPVFVAVDQYVGLGAVGGHVYSLESHGEQAGRIGARILRGEAPAATSLAAAPADKTMVDWRQLRRWNLDEGRLPPDAVVLFREPSLWDTYKWELLGGIALLVLQSALLVALLVNRAQRRRAEEEVLRQRAELAHALRVNTLGELTASIAHELGQPLTAISANARAAGILLERKPHDEPDVMDAVKDIAKATLRATETVTRLRALYRKEPAATRLVDVNDAIEDVTKLLASDLRAKDIAVAFQRREGLPPVLADDIQLLQVLMNVFVNAADAIVHAGSGPREIRVEVVPSASPGRLRIDIADTGVGVPEADLERIFEHFVTTKREGLGMGLAISRSIVEAHHGRIWATRNAGRGITMHVELPVGG